MRSKILQKILDETPPEIDEHINKYVNMMQVVEQTHEEKVAMYMKLPKNDLVVMLLANIRLVESLRERNSFLSYSTSPRTSVIGSYSNSSISTTPLEVIPSQAPPETTELHLSELETERLSISGKKTIKIKFGEGDLFSIYVKKKGRWKDITDYGNW